MMDADVKALMTEFAKDERSRFISLIIYEKDAQKKSYSKILELKGRYKVETWLRFMPYVTIMVLGIVICCMFKGCSGNVSGSNVDQQAQRVVNAEVKTSAMIRVSPEVDKNSKKN